MRFAPITRLSISILALASACSDPAEPVDAGRDAPSSPPRDAGPALCAHEGPLDARVPLSFTDLCVEGIVPTGFGLRWQHAAQRVARIGLAIDLGAHPPEACPPPSSHRGATLAITVSGGQIADEPDDAVAFFDYQVIGAIDDGAIPGDAGTSAARVVRGSTTIDLVDGATEGTGLALVDLAAAGIADDAEIAVVLDGFDLDTDLPQSTEYPPAWTPQRGYASRGIGFAIDGVERDGTTLRVMLRARFEHGRGDRPAWDPGHDTAITVARTRAIVRFVAIVAEAAPSRAEIAYDLVARQSDPLELGAACRPPPAESELEIAGMPGHDRAVVGLSRFDLRLWPDDPGIGDQVRELSIRLRDVVYDPATGRATLRVDGYASNEGPLPRHGLRARVEAEVTMAQWTGGGEITHVSVGAPSEVGRQMIQLPMR